eukprot:4261243-Amphidinium_carterae.1
MRLGISQVNLPFGGINWLQFVYLPLVPTSQLDIKAGAASPLSSGVEVQFSSWTCNVLKPQTF